MGINTYERFENHMDISFPDTIGDAEKIEDFYQDYDNNDEFEKQMSEVEATKEQYFSADVDDDKQDSLSKLGAVFEEKLSEVRIENIDKWISNVNPNFDEFDCESPYCNNCGSCAYAVYQRLEGNSDICATAENIDYNSDMEALTGMKQVSMSPMEIKNRLLSEGNGAHAIIGIDRAEGAGHWFNAACIDGKVIAIDGQDGSISEWPPDYGDVTNWEMSIKKEKNNG